MFFNLRLKLSIFFIGTPIENLILLVSGIFKEDGFPGIVVFLMVVACFILIFQMNREFHHQKKLINKLSDKIKDFSKASFAKEGPPSIGIWLRDQKVSYDQKKILSAWDKFEKTLISTSYSDNSYILTTVQPDYFFNTDALSFGLGRWRIIPGLFVSIGLACTFLGLIAALHQMADQQITSETMQALMKIASAKFIMSLAGLVCSIVFMIFMTRMKSLPEHALHDLVSNLDEHLSPLSLEKLGQEQLDVQQQILNVQKTMANDFVAELGRSLKEDVTPAISNSISEVMHPIISKVSQHSTDSITTMATNLSQQISGGVEHALTVASERIAMAGDRIAQLVERMDLSSGRMGSEIENTIVRVSQAVDDLRNTINEEAISTSGVFVHGAEQLLATMNTTLESIRDNTGIGARAISDAATNMATASKTMRAEMEEATQSGSKAAYLQISEAGNSVSMAIDSAGQSVLSAFGNTANKVAELAGDVGEKAGRELLEPISLIAEKLERLLSMIDSGVLAMRDMSNSVQAGAHAGEIAANSFQGASSDLVNATQPIRSTTEQIENILRILSQNIESFTTIITRSAETTAISSANVLKSAKETLGGEQRSIEIALQGVEKIANRMQGQAQKLDDIDLKLGHAFEVYAMQTGEAMDSMRTHVVQMANELNKALDTLKTIVDQLQDFVPQQGHD